MSGAQDGKLDEISIDDEQSSFTQITQSHQQGENDQQDNKDCSEAEEKAGTEEKQQANDFPKKKESQLMEQQLEQEHIEKCSGQNSTQGNVCNSASLISKHKNETFLPEDKEEIVVYINQTSSTSYENIDYDTMSEPSSLAMSTSVAAAPKPNLSSLSCKDEISAVQADQNGEEILSDSTSFHGETTLDEVNLQRHNDNLLLSRNLIHDRRCDFTIYIPNFTPDADNKNEGIRIADQALSLRSASIPQNLDCNNQIDNMSMELSGYIASPDSKYEYYSVIVDRTQDDKANAIPLQSLQRPHSRAFHAAWFSMFVSFFTWFAITPLLSEIQFSLNLSKEQIWTSSIFGTAGTVIMRILMGPACDKYGARVCLASILVVSAVPTVMIGFVNSSTGLSIVRLFIGIAGSSFVASNVWTSAMFTREVAGTANALVSGWGNLGTGVTQIVMGSVFFPLLKLLYGNTDANDLEESSEKAWRTVFIFPAIMCLITAIVIIRGTEDCPKGNYHKRKKDGQMNDISASNSLRSAIIEENAWILFVQYACAFGVEVTMNNAAALYFKERFGQTTETAAAIASIFGVMNLFARGLGGFGSDMFNAKYGVQGRSFFQFISLFLQGITTIMFSVADSLAGAIFSLIFFSLFVQCSEGSTFGIVPYVNPKLTGGVIGLVGAGGTLGGVIFAVIFRTFDYNMAFSIIGASVMLSSILSFTLNIQGSYCGCLTTRRDHHTPAPRATVGDDEMDEEAPP